MVFQNPMCFFQSSWVGGGKDVTHVFKFCLYEVQKVSQQHDMDMAEPLSDLSLRTFCSWLFHIVTIT